MKRKNPNGPRLFLILGLMFIGFSLIPFVANDEGDLTGLIMSVACMGGIGLAFVIGAGATYYTRWRVGTPEVMISQDTLRVGDRFTAAITHQFKGGVQIEQILVQLVLRETATYQQGTDTRTVTHNHVIENYEYPGGSFGSGNFFQESYDLQIPADSMHTLEVRRNAIQWFFTLKMVIPRLPDYKDEFELTVLPELAPAAEESIWG